MKISVVVPFYNVENYLSRCVLSIIGQSYKDLEIILVNDGSSDRSLDIAKSYAAQDSRIVVLSQKNMGQACARNAGLRMATGEFVSFVDSDDWLEPNMLEQLINIIERDRSDVVQCRFQFDNETTGKQTLYRNFDKSVLCDKAKIISDALLTRNILVAPWAKLFSRSFLADNGLFCEEGIVNEDTLFTIKFSCLAQKVSFSNDILYHAIEREGSTSRSSYQRLCSHMVIALNKAREFYIEKGLFPKYEPIFKARYLKSIQYNLLQSAQRLVYVQYKDIWCWNMSNSDYKKFNRHAFRKYLPFKNRLMLSVFKNCLIFYCVVKVANFFNVRMH